MITAYRGGVIAIIMNDKRNGEKLEVWGGAKFCGERL
jgi:hypothetical protein